MIISQTNSTKKLVGFDYRISMYRSWYSHAFIWSNNDGRVCNASVQCMANGIKLHPSVQHAALPLRQYFTNNNYFQTVID